MSAGSVAMIEGVSRRVGSMAVLAAIVWCAPASAQPATVQSFEVIGDTIPAPLGGLQGDATRGRAIVTNRQVGLCLLCHTGPFPEERAQGTLAPSLAGAGARLSEGQLRLRIVDARRVNPATIMPSYHRVAGLVRVGPAWRGAPVLSAQQVEDVVAFVRTLRE